MIHIGLVHIIHTPVSQHKENVCSGKGARITKQCSKQTLVSMYVQLIGKSFSWVIMDLRWKPWRCCCLILQSHECLFNPSLLLPPKFVFGYFPILRCTRWMLTAQKEIRMPSYIHASANWPPQVIFLSLLVSTAEVHSELSNPSCQLIAFEHLSLYIQQSVADKRDKNR